MCSRLYDLLSPFLSFFFFLLSRCLSRLNIHIFAHTFCIHIYLRLSSQYLYSFILPHLPYAARFGGVYANMRNCNAGEILSDYANVLAETGTCLQEADEDREFASSHAQANIFLSSFFFHHSIFISIRHPFHSTWISEKLLPRSSCSEKRATLKNR